MNTNITTIKEPTELELDSKQVERAIELTKHVEEILGTIDAIDTDDDIESIVITLGDIVTSLNVIYDLPVHEQFYYELCFNELVNLFDAFDLDDAPCELVKVYHCASMLHTQLYFNMRDWKRVREISDNCFKYLSEDDFNNLPYMCTIRYLAGCGYLFNADPKSLEYFDYMVDVITDADRIDHERIDHSNNHDCIDDQDIQTNPLCDVNTRARIHIAYAIALGLNAQYDKCSTQMHMHQEWYSDEPSCEFAAEFASKVLEDAADSLLKDLAMSDDLEELIVGAGNS